MGESKLIYSSDLIEKFPIYKGYIFSYSDHTLSNILVNIRKFEKDITK